MTQEMKELFDLYDKLGNARRMEKLLYAELGNKLRSMGLDHPVLGYCENVEHLRNAYGVKGD